MKQLKYSHFKNEREGLNWYADWSTRVLELNRRSPERKLIETSLGSTLIYLTGNQRASKKLVVFPGFRTSVLFWDLDAGLSPLLDNYAIYLVETNGQPNSSDGNSPAIKSLDYGQWALELLDALHLDSAFIAGASFGGLVCAKLSIVAPSRISGCFLLNPGCLQPFSMNPKNLYLNLKPIFSPKPKNILQFLQRAVFCKPNHTLSEKAMSLCLEYEEYVLKNYRDKTQKPYFMKNELREVKVPVYLLLGDNDLLFPTKTSVKNARKYLPSLSEVKIFKEVGHGIETYRPALAYIDQIMNGVAT